MFAGRIEKMARQSIGVWKARAKNGTCCLCLYGGSRRADIHFGREYAHETVYVDAD